MKYQFYEDGMYGCQQEEQDLRSGDDKIKHLQKYLRSVLMGEKRDTESRSRIWNNERAFHKAKTIKKQ